MNTLHKLLKIIIPVCLSIMPFMAFAQDSITSLSEKDHSNLQRRAAEKVRQMNDYISFMADKKRSFDTRVDYKGYALNLFIARGLDYEENGINKEGVLMQVTSINRGSTRNRLIRDYFDGLIRLKYSQVKITSTEIADMKVSNLRKVDDGLYVCTCQYDQAFVGYGGDGTPIYRDITTKRIKCYVYLEETEDGIEYIVRLGDITALETKRY